MVSVTSFTGALDGVLLSSTISCDTSGYTILNCGKDSLVSLSLSSTTLLPNTFYWVMIDGSASNQTNFQISVFGDAVQWVISDSTAGVLCKSNCDGFASVSTNNGISPYTYQWSTGVCSGSACSGLCPGSYNVTITDSTGCFALETVTVDSLPPATVSITSTNQQCNNACNGTATASLSGGKTPYSYAWSTSPVQSVQTATGLCNDTFSVTVTDASGCDTSSSVIISTLQPATASVTIIPALCPCIGNVSGSGSASASLSSGPSPKTYLWSTSPVQTDSTATGLCPGIYSVIITDSAGCNTSANGTITLGTSPLATVTVEVICGNDCNSSATVQFTSTQMPFTYFWNVSPSQNSATATGLCEGTDSVIVTDNAGCKDTATFTVPSSPDISSLSLETTDVKCGNLGTISAVVEGGSEPFSYTWSTGESTSKISNLTPGSYSVTVTDKFNCSKKSEGYVVEAECDELIKPDLKFSPNGDGINDIWILQNAQKFPENKVIVYNRWGQRVYTGDGYDNVNEVWEGKLIPDGIYFYIIYKDKENKKDKDGLLYGNVTILR